MDYCECLDPVRRNYQRKLNGPIVDRIDIWRELQPMAGHRGNDRFARRLTSADLRSLVRPRARNRRLATPDWASASTRPCPDRC